MFLTTLSFPPTARPPWSRLRLPPWLWWMAPPRPLMTRTSLQWWRLKRSLQSRSKPIRLPRGSDSSDLEIKTTDDDGDVFLNSDHKYIVLTGQSPAELQSICYLQSVDYKRDNFLFIFLNISRLTIRDQLQPRGGKMREDILSGCSRTNTEAACHHKC